MNYIKRNNGFTLIEVLAVIIIIAGLAAIAIPRVVASTANARQKSDVATAHQVKAALDRYQVENGVYPKNGELTVNDVGEVVTSDQIPKLIPKYISKLDKSTTQQALPIEKKGFRVVSLGEYYIIPDTKPVANTIMIYLSDDGLAAEVRAYDETLEKVLWTSAN